MFLGFYFLWLRLDVVEERGAINSMLHITLWLAAKTFSSPSYRCCLVRQPTSTVLEYGTVPYLSDAGNNR